VGHWFQRPKEVEYCADTPRRPRRLLKATRNKKKKRKKDTIKEYQG
jgi:hypothetical protein